jgi:hypothetical protein
MDPEDVFTRFPEGADAPVEGYYSVDRRGKVGLPMHLWFGPPIDQDDGSYELERSPRWQMQLGDRFIDPSDPEWEEVWPQCLKSPLSIGEFKYRLERIVYAKEHGAPSDPWARRSGKIDLLTAPIPE